MQKVCSQRNPNLWNSVKYNHHLIVHISKSAPLPLLCSFRSDIDFLLILQGVNDYPRLQSVSYLENVSGLWFEVCCCGFWYCNQHSLGTLLVLEITASVKPSVLTQILYLAQLSKILAPRGKTSQWNIRMMMRREKFSKRYHSTSNRNWILLTANLNLVKRDFSPP